MTKTDPKIFASLPKLSKAQRREKREQKIAEQLDKGRQAEVKAAKKPKPETPALDAAALFELEQRLLAEKQRRDEHDKRPLHIAWCEPGDPAPTCPVGRKQVLVGRRWQRYSTPAAAASGNAVVTIALTG